MHICVFNGSPRGDYSVTLQCILYLQKFYKFEQYEIINVSQKIKHFSKDFSLIKEAIEKSEMIIFCYPVYTFLAPSQLHLFISLLKENNISFVGKFITQITTSKHFYDITAHRYIEDNCYDLLGKYIKGLSLDMEDLLKEKGQNSLREFHDYFIYCYNNNLFNQKQPTTKENTKYEKNSLISPKTNKYDTVLVTDLKENDLNLKLMIEDFINMYPYPVRVININEYPFSGGCLGCFNCVSDGSCIYKDGFDSFLREKIQIASGIVYAFTIKDHSMGPLFKMYDDRQFCNGHRTVMENTPVGYLINGNFDNEENLKCVIEARSEVGHNFFAGVVNQPNEMETMVKRLIYSMEHYYTYPRNFYGVGGMKIFRDLIWVMRGLMHADHKYYKKHGVYDFPQKERGKMIKICLLGSLIRNKKIKAKMGNKFNEGMIAPYKKVIDSLDK